MVEFKAPLAFPLMGSRQRVNEPPARDWRPGRTAKAGPQERKAEDKQRVSCPVSQHRRRRQRSVLRRMFKHT